MTSMLNHFIRAARVPLVITILLAFPASAWPQEQSSGTLAVPPSVPEQAAAEAGAPAPAAAAEQPGTYTIREGDTLWDISNAHYRDPFLWPLIWKSNTFIDNPDLIYPGKTLVIPSLAPVERAMAAPAAPAEVKEQAPPAPPAVAAAPPAAEPEGIPSFFRQKTIESLGPEPETPYAKSRLLAPEETRPTLMDKYGMLSGGFVSDERSEDYIIGSAIDPGKALFGYDDVVFISVKSRQDVKVGDLFLIFNPDHRVDHPVNNRYYGKLNRVMGILKVTIVRDDGPLTARITLSFSEAQPGSLLTAFQEPAPLYPPDAKQIKDISGYILEVTDRRSISAQVDIVFLDRGKIDGVGPGDRFQIYSETSNDVNVPKPLGEAEVFLVKERTATAVIRKSTDVISRGDRFRYQQ